MVKEVRWGRSRERGRGNTMYQDDRVEDNGVIMVVKGWRVADRSDAVGCAFRWFCDWRDVMM